MALLPILQYPDPRLRKKALPVMMITDEITTLISDMIETMYDDHGVGLAATQVNAALQILVMDVTPAHDGPICLINPEIIAHEGTVDSEEGCLSVPGIFNTVKRHRWVHVRAIDRHGKPIEIKTEDYLSLCIQHEMDHLNGILFIDRLSSLKRQLAIKKLEKNRRQIF
jgi:peptide deformylase